MKIMYGIPVILLVIFIIDDIINFNISNLILEVLVLLSYLLIIIKPLFKTREEKILESCGNVCFCSNCHEPLNDNSECETLCDSGIYKYTCAKCSTETVFHFGIAPCPIWLKDYGKDKLSIDT